MRMPEIINTKIVGVTHKNEDGSHRQEIIEMHEVGDPLFLERDPLNEHDPNAIEVRNKFAELLGYIGRRIAKELAPKLDAGVKTQCVIKKITGGYDEDYNLHAYGCAIEITLYTDAEWNNLSWDSPKTETKAKAIEELPHQPAEKLEVVGKTMQDVGNNMTQLGCGLTLFITFPVVGAFVGGILGSVIGLILGSICFVSFGRSRNK